MGEKRPKESGSNDGITANAEYTSLQRVADGPSGAKRVLVCYDRMGTEPPAAPPECQPDRVETFCMRVSINA